MNEVHELSDNQRIALIAGAALWYKKKKYGKNRRRWWTRPWIIRRTTENRGTLKMLFEELQHEDTDSYFNFRRMDVSNFEYLLSKTEAFIRKKDTLLRESIPARERLALTLRFLATGECYKSMNFNTRIGTSTISNIVVETCAALYKVLKDEFLKAPSTPEEWRQVQENFKIKWNFPNCIGALDGKHIEFRAPREEGSTYRNYHGADSIVLMALTDANYKFICIDVGVNGRVSDGGVFRESNLHTALEEGLLNLPPSKPLPGRQMPVPPVIVADDAFPLRQYIMKPYPQRNLTHNERIFNYRLSRTRMVVKNSFGILSNRFRVFLTKINLSPEKVKLITLTCCALHNFLLERTDAHYKCTDSVDRETADGTFEPGSWRLGPHFSQKMAQQSGNRPSNEATVLRNELKAYFNNEGKVSWQERKI